MNSAYNTYLKATTDTVTGLSNSHHFTELAEREYSRAKLLQKPISILLIDIDHLQTINDQYGQQAGDRALCRLAHCLEKNAREMDICGRYGDDKFAILLPDLERSAALVVAIRILNCICNTGAGSPQTECSFEISIGIGHSLSPPSGGTIDQLIHHADQALNRAKRDDQNRVYLSSAC